MALKVFGTTIPKLARARVSQHADAAGLSYDEREYHKEIETRKLRVEYYERTGHFEKRLYGMRSSVRAWNASVRQSLASWKPNTGFVVAGCGAIRSQAAEMTDQELNRLVAGHKDDDAGGC